jgi:hypothetical protein
VKRTLALWAVLTAAAIAISAGSGSAGNKPGFDTARPAQLVADAGSGVTIDPILSTGDVVGSYQMSGIPDGLGAYNSGKNSLVVLMNHELGITFPALPPGVNARVSKVTLNRKTRTVLSGTYVFNGSEGFERFCSSTLATFNGTAYYFTGEEAIDVGHDGSSVVVNAETGQWTEAPHFGHLNHENVVPVKRLSKAVFVTTDDDFRVGQPAYLYAYIADTFQAAVSGDPAHGSLYVWKATNTAKTDLAKGETIPGEFVPIPQSQNTSSSALKAAATALHAFRFARLEDAATARQHPGRLYFTDTGKSGENILNGALYRLDVSPGNPTKASLTLLLDGDHGDGIFRPDNLDTSAHAVVIQEDGGQNRVLVYDIKTGNLRSVARTPNTAWESSGVINAQTFLGEGWWLMDVQAHSSTAPQPGPAAPGVQPVPNTATGEDGQLLAVRIPNS